MHSNFASDLFYSISDGPVDELQFCSTESISLSKFLNWLFNVYRRIVIEWYIKQSLINNYWVCLPELFATEKNIEVAMAGVKCS